jgi:hypothetical protein
MDGSSPHWIMGVPTGPRVSPPPNKATDYYNNDLEKMF